MQKITTAAELKTAIKQLEAMQANELSLIKGEFLHVCDSLQPINLIKNSFKSIISSPDLKDNIIDTSIGLAAGLLSKAIIIGTSHNPIKKLLGTVLQAGMPVAASVTIVGTALTVVPNPTGYYTVSGVTPGTGIVVRAELTGTSPLQFQEQTITLIAGEALEVIFTFV